MMTVHLGTIRIHNQLDALFNVFISLLYMFRATQCSSSGESIVSIHRLIYITPCRWPPGRQPYAPAAFTPGKIPGTHFRRLSRPQGTWFCRKEPRKKSPVTPPGIDPRTVRLVAQRLNHYATPGPQQTCREVK
jgi:hypothetical protein